MSFLYSWWRQAKKSQFLRGVATLVSANVAGQLILLAAMPLLTRLYAPEDFGVLAVFMATLSVVLVISSLRYELAIPLPSRDRDAGQLLMLALGINLISAMLVALLVVFLRESIAEWADTPALAPLLWLLPLVIVAAGSYKALNYWAVRRRDYRRIAHTRIGQALANVATQLAAGIIGLGAIGLVAGQAVGQSVGVTRLAAGLPLRELLRKVLEARLRNRVLLKRYQKFPRYDVPAALVNSVSQQLPNILLAVLFGPAVVGLYFLADRVLATPMSMMSQAVSQVFYGDARNLLTARVALHRSLQVLLFMSALVIFPTVVLVLFSEPLFVWMFGEAWRQAGVYAGWLILGLSVQFLYGPLSMMLIATEGQAINLALHALILVMKAAAIMGGFWMDNALVSIIFLSFALMAGYAIGVAVVITRLLRVS